MGLMLSCVRSSSMERINALERSYILAKLLVTTAVGMFPPDPPIEFIIREVFTNFKFFNEQGLLQFWACTTAPNSEDVGWRLMLADQPFVSTGYNKELEDHRRICLEKNGHFVGCETKVGNWFAGRAVQTQIADQRTIHSVEAAGKGQLVLPVFHGWGAEKKLVGIIELVTIVPKESYFEDFRQMFCLLQAYGLQSKYMGKMIKVEYDGVLIKFPLPYSARLTDLHRKVTKRFQDLRQKTFCIVYKDDGVPNPVSSDELLQNRIDQSILSGETLIRMHVKLIP